MQTLRLDSAMFSCDILDIINFQTVMTQVATYLFVTLMFLQMEDLAAKEEAANLKAATFKRSRQELEETTGPAVKKVCLAVKQLGSKKQEVVANGLQVIEASAKIIGPAVAQSKNKKRREERGRSKKGNQYCGFCKDFFRLDL